MKTSFLPRLVNGQTGDPALFLDILREKRALLFDCGLIHDLSASEILRISDVFVSHCHIDHFIGFEQLLRLHLGRGRRIRVYGPRGITGCVGGKLAGYTWNLVRRQRLVFEVHEFDGQRCTITDFPCRHRFKPARQKKGPPSTVLLADDLLEVKAAVLDHRIPSLAFSVQERDFHNVNPVALAALGLRPGPWLNELKHWVRSGSPAGGQVSVEGGSRAAAPLAESLLIHSPGRKLGYVADCQGNDANAKAVVDLVAGADVLFCEGAFLHADLARARETYHLTAQQAGLIARRAGVRHLVPFHFSPKYDDRFRDLEQEAQSAFEAVGDSEGSLAAGSEER